MGAINRERLIAGAVLMGVPILALLAQLGADTEDDARDLVASPAGVATSARAVATDFRSDRELVSDLEGAISFDTLDGVQYDAARKSLLLAGRRTHPDRAMKVPYLEYLRAALEATEPTFSLEWRPGSKAELDRARSSESFLRAQDPSGNLTPFGVWLFRLGGADVSVATTYEDACTQIHEGVGFEKAFGGRGLIHVPREIVPLAFDAVPMAQPIVKGMSPRSALAHLALEADVATKSLIQAPELVGKVPGYRMYSDWEASRGEVEGDQRMETQPARFEMVESPDGRTMRITHAEMRFVMQKYVGKVSTPDPSLSEYAALLSSRYDALAAEMPVLHRLREGMKMLAVAQWAKEHRWEIAFSSERRTSPPVPEEVPGVVHMLLEIKLPSEKRLGLHSTTWEAGGVDLRFAKGTLARKHGSVEPLPGDSEKCPEEWKRRNNALAALERQQPIGGSARADLERWEKENEDAQRDALQKASDFLVDSILDRIGELEEAKLAAAERDLKRRMHVPDGSTGLRLHKIAEARRQRDLLSARVAGIKIANAQLATVEEAFEGLMGEKEKTTEDVTSLEATLDWLHADPETKALLEKHKVGFIAPWRQVLDHFPVVKLADFLINYGYEAKRWKESRDRILQSIQLTECNLEAIRFLEREAVCAQSSLDTCRGLEDVDPCPPKPAVSGKCRDAGSP